MSSLSDLLPTGGGQNVVDFVASGTLGSGQTVVLNSNGTVSVVAEVPQALGSPTAFDTALAYYNTAVFDSVANKVVIAYRDVSNSNYGTAIVGTVSGTSISFGAEVVFEVADTRWTSATFDSATGKVVIAYQDFGNSGYGTAIVGTVSGTSISFGTAVVFESASTTYIAATFDSELNKVVIAYSDNGNSYYGTAIVGTVSGTSISFGTAVVFKSSGILFISSIFDSTNNKVVIAYRDDFNSLYGTAIVGTVSGTSISFGSEVVFSSSSTDRPTFAYDSTSNRVVIAYKDVGNSNYGTAIVGTVSGTSISFGTAVVFANSGTSRLAATFDSVANKTVIAYQDEGGLSYGKLIVGTVTNDTITFGSETVFDSSSSRDISTTYDSESNKVVIAYKSSSYGTGIVFTTPSSNNTSFIGITAEAIANTATGPVNVFGGINEAQSGLTIAADYYVQTDGSIATTVSDVLIGQAISATTINIRDLT
jgi:hypothetical protein